MKSATVVKTLLGRILLPLGLLCASVFRQNIISLLYFLLLVASPLVPGPSRSFTGPFRGYLILVIIYSLLACVGQLVFQLYLILYSVINHQVYGQVLDGNCDLVDTLQLVGFVRVDTPIDQRYQAVRMILPDGVILVISVITYFAISNVYKRLSQQTALPATRKTSLATGSKRTGFIKKIVQNFGEVIIIVLVGISGAMVPSVISAFYFIMFLGIAIYWALHLKFYPKYYSVLKYLVFVYLTLHMVLIYLCQLNYLQRLVDSEDAVFYARLLGLTPLITSSCSAPWDMQFEHYSWPHFANPLVLFATFIAISLDFAYRRAKHQSADSLAEGHGDHSYSPFLRSRYRSSERQSLVSSPSQNYDAITSTPPHSPQRRPSGNDGCDEIVVDTDQMGDLGPPPPQERSLWYSIYLQFLKQSYLLAFIVMLLWAVLYPSWTAFAFLLLGCILWLFPNSRRASLICSPVVVFYALCLSVLQYVCSINFGGVDFNSTLFFDIPDNYTASSVGIRGYDYPFVVVTVKLCFMFVFCVVLREFRREMILLRMNPDTDAICLSPMHSDTSVQGETTE